MYALVVVIIITIIIIIIILIITIIIIIVLNITITIMIMTMIITIIIIIIIIIMIIIIIINTFDAFEVNFLTIYKIENVQKIWFDNKESCGRGKYIYILALQRSRGMILASD